MAKWGKLPSCDNDVRKVSEMMDEIRGAFGCFTYEQLPNGLYKEIYTPPKAKNDPDR